MKEWRQLCTPVLVLLCFAPAPCRAAQLPSITVLSPPHHSVWNVDVNSGAVATITLELAVRHFHVPQDGVVRISGEKIGESGEFASPSTVIALSDIQLGSHFWTFTLAHTNGSVVQSAAPATVHMDVVLPQHSSLPRWHHALSPTERRPKILFNLPFPAQPRPPSQPRRRRRLCVVGWSNGQFDGQKKMWLQTIAALPHPEWETHFLTFERAIDHASVFVKGLTQLNVTLHSVPLTISEDELAASTLSTASDTTLAIVSAFAREFGSVHSHVSMESFQRRVAKLEPTFTVAPWRAIVAALHDSCQDAVFTIANARSVGDQFLVAAARIARVRAIIMEMANLHPVALRVDVLVAPSQYTLHHPSVSQTIAARQRHAFSAGIDTAIFHPTMRRIAHGSFTIGYVGRLATEKMLGFLFRAFRLVNNGCFGHCRLVIVGDGSLRAHLEVLAKEWKLTEFVQFVGGIYTEKALASYLQRMDVVVSPRFDETLGIAPLEAMSCGVPVVGFASGGVGEYLEHDVNGLVVHEATAEAIRDALTTLRDDEPLRRRLGAQARRTVLQRFNLTTGVQQYVRLYERLAR